MLIGLNGDNKYTVNDICMVAHECHSKNFNKLKFVLIIELKFFHNKIEIVFIIILKLNFFQNKIEI